MQIAMNDIDATKAKEISSLGDVSLKLHGVRLLDENDLPTVEGVLKTFNSASRCAFKRFQTVGLANMMKGHPTPIKRDPLGHFHEWDMSSGRPIAYECPVGMSDQQWSALRRESYAKKRTRGQMNANKFWQRDTDLGSPIGGTIKVVGEWAKGKGYDLDSILLHDATMAGYRNYMSFEKQKSRYRTSKSTPGFGDLESRSRKKISKEEFQLTRNASMTVIGKTKVGNPKFRFDIEHDELSFTFHRKRIVFSFRSHRFSKKGYHRFSDIVSLMKEGKLPVTVTLTMNGKGTFDVALSYSPTRLAMAKKEWTPGDDNVVAAIYATDQMVCHKVVDTRTNRVLHTHVYDITKMNGARNNAHSLGILGYEGRYSDLAKLRKRISNKTANATHEILNRIFKVSKSLGAATVVMESCGSRSRRNFNNSLIAFNKADIQLGSAKPCFMTPTKFLALVKSQCVRNGMKLKKVNGAFLQMKAVLDAKRDMVEALENACASLIDRNANGFDISLTNWSEFVQDPSMLDWVKHLLHNRRSRQARMEIRKAFTKMAVEKAASLLDNRRTSGR